MRACGASQTRDMIGTCCISARLSKSHPISRHVSQTAPGHARRISIILFHPTADDTKFTAPGLRRTSCAIPPADMLFAHLAESSPHTSWTLPAKSWRERCNLRIFLLTWSQKNQCRVPFRALCERFHLEVGETVIDVSAPCGRGWNHPDGMFTCVCYVCAERHSCLSHGGVGERKGWTRMSTSSAVWHMFSWSVKTSKQL